MFTYLLQLQVVSLPKCKAEKNLIKKKTLFQSGSGVSPRLKKKRQGAAGWKRVPLDSQGSFQILNYVFDT